MQEIIEQADTIVMADKTVKPLITIAEGKTTAKSEHEAQYATTSFIENTNKKTIQNVKTKVLSNDSATQESCLSCLGRVCADKNFLIPVIDSTCASVATAP